MAATASAVLRFAFVFAVLFSASIANVAAAADDGGDAAAVNNAPFREGVEYLYEWKASVQTGPSASSPNSASATSTRFMGQLIVLSSRDASNSSNWRVILKLKNVSVAVQHGDNASEETTAKWIPAPAELDNQLTGKPFYLLYSSSQVVGASFPSGESVWSANFKRSFASILQLQWPSSSPDTVNNKVYSHQELTLNGRCDAQYYIKASTENNGQWIVQKDRDLESCRNSATGQPEQAGRWRTFVQMSSCSSTSSNSKSQDSDGKTAQRLAGATSSTRYVVSVNRGHPELLHIESSGSVWLDPFGILQSAMKSTTTLKMHLEKTRRSSESTGDASLVFGDQLRFVFGTVQKPVDLKAAQNLMLRAQPALMSSPVFQEQMRRKSQLDLLSAVDALPAAASSSSGGSTTTTEQQRLALSSVAYQLGSLDYTNAKALFRDLSIAATNEKLVNAKSLMLDLLLHSGSNVGIILLRDLATERAIDEWTAARLVAYAGAYVKEPSEALVQAVQQMQNKDFWPEAEMFHRAAVLAVSSLIGKSCSDPTSSCNSVRIDDWRKKYLDVLTGSGSSYAEKGLNVHALHNIGYGTSNVLDALLEFAAKTTQDESANDLRCYVIKGFALKSSSSNGDDDDKVWNILVALVRDSAESFRVRIEAVKALLGTQPTARAVQEMRRLLLASNEGGLGDGQVRHYVTSAVKTIAESRNPCNRHLKEMARDVLDALPESMKSITSSLSSSEFSYDFLDDNSQFGSQLNMRTVYSEFDDMPGFVDGKVLYYVKGSIVQPYSFTLRGSGMRRYITSLSSSSWRESDLNTVRFQQTMDTFQFASRKESAGTGADVAFTLHGTTVMFHHMDKAFLNKIGQSATSLDFLQDLSFNFQRYAAAGALLYTQPDGLGLPVSFVFSAPLIIGIKGSMTKTKVPGMIGRHIQLSLYGQIDGDQGILSHPMEHLTQGVVRNRKATFHVPLNVEMNTDIGKLQMDFTYATPKLSEAMEINSVARTILTLRPSSPDAGKLLAQTCSGCNTIHVIKNDNKPLITETIVNASWPVSGIEAHAQIFECDQESARNGRVGGPLGLAFTALNPTAMNHRSSVAAWAYLSFLRLQHHIFIQPEGSGQCGYRGRIFRSTYLPVKEMITRLRVKQSGGGDEMELSLQSGKVSLKAELIWKGETSASDRKGEIDVIYEYRNGGHRNTLSVRAVVIKSQLVPDLNKGDVMVCLKAESTIQSPPTNDVINIDGYTQPAAASASVEYVMGFANSQQCPTNQTRFKLLLKAQAGQWVMERIRQMKQGGDKLLPTYYAECQAEKGTGNWAQGQTPQTDSCYQTAVDFTTLSNFQFEMRSASLSARMEKVVARLGQLGSLMMLPYWEDSEAVPLPPSSQKDVSVVNFNISFHPTTSAQDPQLINLSVASGNGQIEKYKDVKLAFGQITLPSTSVPRTTRIAYENNLVPSCLVTSQYVRSLDKVMLPGSNHFTPCYTIVSSDCGTSPLYAVFVRRTTGQHPLAVKVLVGGHTIEILPDESGRRKELIVRANDIDVDIIGNSNSSSFTLPEGRDKQFYVLKVRYQAPLYVITSPGAGLMVHYSGSHVAVFPTWFHRNQHCGLCGNFDGEPDAEREWSNPQGCPLQNGGANNVTQLVASYTLGTNCFPNYKKFAC